MRTAAPTLITTLALITTSAITLIGSNQANAEIAWQENLRTAHAQAQSEGKLLLLHFYSDSCSWCERLESGAFTTPQVGEAISQRFVPVKINASSSPKLAEMFKVSKFPTDVIVTVQGKTLSHSVSPQNPDRYVAMLTSTSDAMPAAPATSVASDVPTMQPAVEATTVSSKQPVSNTPAASTPPSVSTKQPIPGYAVAASPSAAAGTTAAPSPSTAISAPTATTASPKPASGMTLPTANLSNGVQATLAGSRSEGLTLEMPEQIEPSSSIATSVTDATSAQVVQGPGEAQALEEQPELAMQGFCPVTVINEDKWVEGKPEFGVIHLGKLYLFTNAENMKTFLNDPVPYTPVLNEIDVVRFFEERKIVPGKREWGLKDPTYNRMFFFADEAAMTHFYNEYEKYTDSAIEVMAKAVKDANPGS